MRKLLVRQLLILSVLCAAPRAEAQTISDTFEAPSLDPAWSIVLQQQGSASLSTDQNQTPGGLRSLKLASISGGQRNIIVRRSLGASMKGRVSIDFYDASPGQETLYITFSLTNSVALTSAMLGTEDYDAFCYTAAMGHVAAGVNLGPGQPCGIHPGPDTTSVSRTGGWHRFSVDVGTNTTSFSIDSTVVYTFPASFSFDTVQMDLTGPGSRPDTVVYFDNFTFTPLAGCDLQLSSPTYTNGGLVTVPVFRITNNTAAPLATEIKSWVNVPGAAPYTLINAGADGSVLLPASLNVNLGPFNLFPVTAANPRGGYELGCRILDPKTGAVLGQSQFAFVIQ